MTHTVQFADHYHGVDPHLLGWSIELDYIVYPDNLCSYRQGWIVTGRCLDSGHIKAIIKLPFEIQDSIAKPSFTRILPNGFKIDYID